MLLKRLYDRPDGWAPKRDERGRVLNPPPVAGVEVKHTGVSAEQNWSEKLVKQGIEEGWISLSKGKLVVHTRQEDLQYKILRMPGHYCCHCGEAITDGGLYTPDEEGVTFGMRHVKEAHQGAPSPDPTNPIGYERINHYETVLEQDQHKKYSLARRAHG